MSSNPLIKLKDNLTATANAIREKTGKSDKLGIEDFADEIKSISTGTGGDSRAFSEYVNATKDVITADDLAGATHIRSFAFAGNCTVLHESSTGEMIVVERGLQQVTLPEGIRTIGEGAFGGCYDLVKLELNTDLQEIGPEAFADNCNVSQVYIPDSVRFIGYSAFGNWCGEWSDEFFGTTQRIFCESGAPKPDWEDDWHNNLPGVYYGCKVTENGLVYYQIEASIFIVGYIGNSSELVIPDYIDGYRVDGIEPIFARWAVKYDEYGEYREIEPPAFTDLTVPFTGMYRTPNSDVPATCYPFGVLFGACAGGWGQDIPRVDGHLFPTIQLGDVEVNAFFIPLSLKNVTVLGDVSDSAFAACDMLENITLVNTERIGRFAFRYCAISGTLTIPNTVKYVGFDAFDGVGKVWHTNEQHTPVINYLGTPDDYCTIEEEAGGDAFFQTINQWLVFKGEVPTVIELHTTKIVPNDRFRNLQSVVSVVFTNVIQQIDEYAFYGCSQLKRVDFSDCLDIVSCSYSVFKNCHDTLQIKVPANLIDEWKAATNWEAYADKIVTEFTNEV